MKKISESVRALANVLNKFPNSDDIIMINGDVTCGKMRWRVQLFESALPDGDHRTENGIAHSVTDDGIEWVRVVKP